MAIDREQPPRALLHHTHKDLDAAVLDGRFRADLFYRLNVFPMRAPALRGRREDTPALVRYSIMKYADGKVDRVDPYVGARRAVGLRVGGNVQELANVLERPVIISRSTTLELGDWIGLPRDLGAAHLEPAPWIATFDGGSVSRVE